MLTTKLIIDNITCMYCIVQKLAVRQLKDAYENLAEGQRRLTVASNTVLAQERREISSAPALAGPGQRKTRVESQLAAAKAQQEPAVSLQLAVPVPNDQPSPRKHHNKHEIGHSNPSPSLGSPRGQQQHSQEPHQQHKPQPPTRPKSSGGTGGGSGGGTRKLKSREHVAESSNTHGTGQYEGVVIGSALEEDKPASAARRTPKHATANHHHHHHNQHDATTFITANNADSVSWSDRFKDVLQYFFVTNDEPRMRVIYLHFIDTYELIHQIQQQESTHQDP
jgi:hypothetical protein